DHTVRIALSRVLAPGALEQAVSVLEGLLYAVPGHTPALRLLERLLRKKSAWTQLASTLGAQAEVSPSRGARVGALWEIAALEDRVGPAITLDALVRIARGEHGDRAALDGIVRIASRLSLGVAIPHPAAIAARGHLHAALRARRALTLDPIA